jgi:FAD-linked sulfhydryl oxidase
MHSGCPLTRREVGRASWAYLHTLAAYYPERPSTQYQQDMRDFLRAYMRFYPCGYCADTSSQEFIRNPPRLETRQMLQMWMCEMHNEVNDRLGKPLFDCTRVDERWRTGGPDCH